jgi:2-polyprenyl-3-methyl-5-hydroxy-6-metoxy-1,4-benzoquinol methylase
MTTLDDLTTQPSTEIDAEGAEEFAYKIVGICTGGLLTTLLEIGRRTGLFEHAAAGPVTSAELASRAGLQERYVREWLAAMVTGGIFEYDVASGHYWLPAEHSASLTGDGVENLLPAAYLVSAITSHVDGVTSAFRVGGGVPYGSYLPQLHDVMDQLWQPMYRDLLVDEILVLAPGLVERLESGARLADVCCGTGNGLLVLAERFPQSQFVGYDADAEAVAIARDRTTRMGLTNLSFEVCDAATLRTDEPFDVVLVFNAIHDQARPAEVVRAIRRALVPSGIFLLNEPRISSHLERNVDNPLAAMIYSISLLHCMTVSLAEGGAGLGTGWGEELAVNMLAGAGFADVVVHDAPGDPFNAVFVTRA